MAGITKLIVPGYKHEGTTLSQRIGDGGSREGRFQRGMKANLANVPLSYFFEHAGRSLDEFDLGQLFGALPNMTKLWRSFMPDVQKVLWNASDPTVRRKFWDELVAFATDSGHGDSDSRMSFRRTGIAIFVSYPSDVFDILHEVEIRTFFNPCNGDLFGIPERKQVLDGLRAEQRDKLLAMVGGREQILDVWE